MNTGETIALIKALGGSGGGGSSLPAVTSSDNGKVLGVVDGAWAADANLFVVTANGTASVDKTYAEIVAAYEAGKSVYLVNSGATYILSNVDATAVDFVSITNGGKPYTYRISSSNAKFSNIYVMLPGKVGASDNGSEMIVANGAWTKQKKKFLVTLTPTSPDYSGTMDKTVAEINAAYEAGQEIVFRVMTSATYYMDVDCTARWFEGDFTYPSFNGYIVDTTQNVLLFAATSATNDGTKQTYSTTVYALTPAS